MEIEAIQQGLADACTTIPGLQGLPSLPDDITPPVAAVTEFELDYNKTFRGGAAALTETLFSVGVFVMRSDALAARSSLVGYLNVDSETSIKEAIEADRTLGGACKTLIVERVRGAYRLYEVGGKSYLGAIFDVRVWS